MVLRPGKTERDVLALNAGHILRYSSIPEQEQLVLLRETVGAGLKDQTATVALLSFTSAYASVQQQLLEAAAPMMASDFSGGAVKKHFSALRLSALRLNPNLSDDVKSGLDALDKEFKIKSNSLEIRWNREKTGIEYSTVQKNMRTEEVLWIKSGAKYTRSPEGVISCFVLYVNTTLLPTRF